MWLSIEEMLGIRLSMKMLSAALKPSELKAALMRQVAAAPSKGSQPLFLMTPAEGDTTHTEPFPTLLSDQIDWVLIDYPGWREMINSVDRFDVLVEAAVNDLSATRSKRGVWPRRVLFWRFRGRGNRSPPVGAQRPD